MTDSINILPRALRAENILFKVLMYFSLYMSGTCTETTKPNNIMRSYN